MKMGTLDWVAWLLVIIGALNWGLMGLSNLNVVELIFGVGMITQIIYILVGLSGLYMLWMGMSKKK